MLLYFRVSNSRSIDKEIEISFIAGDYGDKLPNNVYHIKKYGFSVVKTLALYGANASGKSNILTSIIEGSEIITDGIINKLLDKKLIENNKHYFPNKSNLENKNRPSSYTYGLLIEEVYYEYQIQNNYERITSERLWKFEPNNVIPTTIFERKYNGEKYIWFFNKIFDDNMKNIIKSVTNSTTSLLSEASNYIKNNEIKIYNFVVKIYDWFNEDNLEANNQYFSKDFQLNNSLKYIATNKNYKKELLKVLKDANFNIKDIIINLNNNNEVETAYTIHNDSNKKNIKYSLYLEESTGTKEFIGLFYTWYLILGSGGILFVDEFGSNLHPLIAKYLISLFYKKKGNHQLIFATHYTELLNRDEIRDDQVYFVDKNQEGNTIVYPLSRYIIPKDISLDKIYLQGIFNAVPFITK